MDTSAGAIRVLLVDDEPDFAAVAARHLEREVERIECETATSAAEGLDRLSAGPVDCVVSDLDMPGMDGLEFLRAVREEFDDLPFVLYTGRGSEEVASEAISAGVTDYQRKEPGTEDYQLLANRIVDAVSQVRTARRLGETERWLELILEETKTGIWEWNVETDVIRWNEAMERSLGLEPGSFEGTYEAFERRVHPVDVPRVEAAIARAVENDALFQLEFRKLHEDGRVIWTNGRGRIVRDGREGDRMVGIHHDITVRKRRERERAEDVDAAVERALETFDEPLFVVGPDGDLRRWNDRVPVATGHAEGELDGMQAAALVTDSEREAITDTFEAALATGHASVRAGLRTETDDLAPHEFTAARLTDDAGDPTCLVVVGRPVGEAEPAPVRVGSETS